MPPPSQPARGYAEWNRLLVDHFFTRAKSGCVVRLAIDEDLLRELGGEKDDLVLAALEAAESASSETILDFALELCRSWESSVSEKIDAVPPFVAVLALLVLAVNHGGKDWIAHNYFDRLHDMLGKPAKRIDKLHSAEILWRELERWSAQTLHGIRGAFRTDYRGAQRFVGIARRQLLLAPRERHAIEKAFSAAGLTPDSEPSGRRLHAAVHHATGLLTRTTGLLDSWPKEAEARELLDEIRVHLETWDPKQSTDSLGVDTLSVPIRLVVRSRGARLVDARFEAEVVDGVTNIDRLITCSQLPSAFSSESLDFELRSGESPTGRSVLVDRTNDTGWANDFPWLDRVEFEIEGLNVRLCRDPKTHIVLGHASTPALLEEKELADLIEGQSYLLIAAESSSESTPKFAEELLGEWQPLPLGSGLRYRRFKAAGVGPEVGAGARILTVGGIASGRGRQAFLRFALPEFVIEPGSASIDDLVVRLSAWDDQGRAVASDFVALAPAEEREIDADSSLLSDLGHLRVGSLALAGSARSFELRVTAGDELELVKRLFVDDVPTSRAAVSPADRDAFGERCDDPATAVFQGLEVASDADASLDALPVARLPIEPEDAQFADADAQRVMQLMRVRHRLSWQEAKRLLPRCMSSTSELSFDSGQVLREVQALHSIGVLELEEEPGGGLSRLVGLSPEIALLPRLANRGEKPGLGVWEQYQAVLVGCWLPSELDTLRKSTGRRAGVELVEVHRHGGGSLTPSLRLLLATGGRAIERLRDVAERVGVPIAAEPPLAVQIASSLEAIDHLCDSDRWEPGAPSAAYFTRYFDPHRIGVFDSDESIGDRYLLAECRRPKERVWTFFVVDRDRGRRLQIADRQLARWFVRKQAVPYAVLPAVDENIIVPVELRFPRILERLFSLSSGHCPAVKRYEPGKSPFLTSEARSKFAIPAPPAESLDWQAVRPYPNGSFFLYRQAYGSAAWPRGRGAPLLGISASSITGFALEDA